MLRTLVIAPIAAILFGAPAFAQTPAAPAGMPSVPPHSCAKPELPGRLASSTRINAFNREYNAYGDCIKKYVDSTKSLITAAQTAANNAIDEYNKFNAEIKAETEAK